MKEHHNKILNQISFLKKGATKSKPYMRLWLCSSFLNPILFYSCLISNVKQNGYTKNIFLMFSLSSDLNLVLCSEAKTQIIMGVKWPKRLLLKEVYTRLKWFWDQLEFGFFYTIGMPTVGSSSCPTHLWWHIFRLHSDKWPPFFNGTYDTIPGESGR